MIAIVKRMLEKTDFVELRGEPWLFYVDQIFDWHEFQCVRIPKVTYKEDASIAFKFACWVRNGECTKLMDIAVAANSERMLDELSKNNLSIVTIRQILPEALPHIRAFGFVKPYMHFEKTGAGIRVMMRKKEDES